jgi:hypothetical protein
MGSEMSRRRNGIAAAALITAALVAGTSETAAQTVTDVLTIGTVNVSSGTGQVEVPIYIQDNTGTPIGRDQGPGKRITGFAMQVVYANPCVDTPAVAGQRIDLTGGILASQSADIDSRPKVANMSQSWIYSSAETNGLIPFTAAAAPGDRIGAMVFNLTGCPSGTINLVITPSGGAGALLSSDSSTNETIANGGLSVVNGAINIGKSFFTVAPCRVIDTRNPTGPLGGPALQGGSARTFTITNLCGVPAAAATVSVNVTITNPSAEGHLTFFPTGESPPLVSTINFRAGQTRANNAVLVLGSSGDFDVSCASSGPVDFILDVNGYFQ